MKYAWFEKGAYASKKARAILESFDPQKVKKIAVVRHAALGDMVLVRPFLYEARRFFPNAEITLSIVSHYTYGVPTELADRVHVIFGKDKKNATIYDKIRNIRELGPQDIIFDLANTNRSHWLMIFCKATLKFGFPYRGILRKLLYDIAILRSDFHAEVDCMLDMLKFLGHDPSYPLNFSLPDNRNQKNKQDPYIIYFNGASVPSKRYPEDRIIRLIREAANFMPEYRHLFLEGINENEKAGYLSDIKNTTPNVSVLESKPLDEVTRLLAGSSLVVSTDTGIRNLAIATHTPTVGIFYSTVPFRYTPRYETHSIVMNSNGDIPDVSQVVSKIQLTIEQAKKS